jgi:hypothetical protein
MESKKATPDATVLSGKQVQGHPSNAQMEAYSLNKLDNSGVTSVEEHLLVCDFCCSRLEAIEPVNFVHFTEDGPVYLRATRLSTGVVLARRWGNKMEGGRTLRNVAGARKYLNESFAQMFPEHRCDGTCSPTHERGG